MKRRRFLTRVVAVCLAPLAAVAAVAKARPSWMKGIDPVGHCKWVNYTFSYTDLSNAECEEKLRVALKNTTFIAPPKRPA